MSRTLKMIDNMKSCLEYSLKEKYDIENDDITNEILNIHGLNTDSIEYLEKFRTITSNKLNDVSIDSNSNKNGKTIEGLLQECISPAKKMIGFDYLYKKLRDNFGKSEAKRLMGEMLDFSVGLSDSTNILKNYCWALNASNLVTDGREFGQLPSGPCKHIESYISALCESVHQLSAHLAGAIAIGTFFLDIAHILLYKENITIKTLRDDKTLRKKIKNEFQQFVHSVNHLSRSGIESPFTNLSVFDRPKIKTLITDMNWYFPFDDLDISDDNEIFSKELRKSISQHYVIEYIMEIQNMFLEFFDAGNPLQNGMPFRFPVCTLNISKQKTDDGDYIFGDDKFVDHVCNLDIYRYNIFVSEGTKVASCCRLINDTNLLEYAAQSNSFGGAGVSIGSHRVCTINFNRIALETKSLTGFYYQLEERIESVAMILKSHKDIIYDLEKQGLQPFVTNGWISMIRMFSTYGVLGIYEAAKELTSKYNLDYDVTEEILKFLNKNVEKYTKAHGIVGNIEQIPGESFAIRLAKTDKMLFGEDKVPYVLYANQFVPLWEENTNIIEKMHIDGKYNQLITGGGIVHCTIGEKVTATQAKAMIKMSMNSGCEHFALNAIYNECVNKHVTMGKYDKCPICSKPIVESLTRIVGFFTPVSSWTKERREWEFPKRVIHNLKKELNIEEI